MLNLLPLQKKKMIKNEYKSRVGIVILIFIISTLVILSIFLLPTFFLAHIRFEQASEEMALLSQKIEAEKGLETSLTSIQKEMLEFFPDGSKNTHSPTSLIDSIILNKGSNVILSSFSVRSQGDNQMVFIRGVSKTRDDLITFRKMLEKDSLWSAVELPIANLGPARNNSFSIALTVNQK